MALLITDIVNRKTPVAVHKQHDFSAANHILIDTVQPDEFFAFQIVVKSEGIAGRISLNYDDLKSEVDIIGANNFFSVNEGGIDYLGNSFIKDIDISDGEQKVLWVSLYIPSEEKGSYKGSILLTAGDQKASFELCINVEGKPVICHGDDEPWRFSRLRWLNTYDRQDELCPTKGYIPLEYKDNCLEILGRKIYISETGLPRDIYSYFDQNLKICSSQAKITDNFELIISDSKSGIIKFDAYTTEILEKNDAFIIIQSEAENRYFSYRCKLKAEFDGYLDYEIEIRALEDIEVNDISLKIPYTEKCSRYFMGLGHEGGYRQKSIDFKWDVSKRQNGFWMGGINGGLRCEFRDENFIPPLPLLYYKHRPIKPPKSFSNSGKGGISITEDNDRTVATAYSGQRFVKKDESLFFNFNLLVTPLKELDMKSRLSTRYTHGGDIGNIRHAKSVGATHINVHHCNEYNPYINYPFVANEKLKELITNAHKEGLKVKLYYTIREQSDRTVELQAFRSLGDEIFMRPSGDTGTYQWDSEGLRWFAENIGTDIIPAWKSSMDASINLNGRSRFANYWIEGLRWLIEKQDIDGIYIDDTVIERDTLRRARHLLDKKDGCLIDFHTCNHFCQSNGYGNNANIYLPLMPYMDTVWIGECYDYNKKPDYWLTEICCTPYGLAGEMLQNNGNPYRGMLFGITSRYPRGGEPLAHLWRFMIDYDLENTELIGFWNENNLVKADKEDIYCSLYRGKDRYILSVASWNDNDCDVHIDFNGEDTSLYNIYIPNIPDFQEYKSIKSLDVFVEKGKGCIIVMDKK